MTLFQSRIRKLFSGACLALFAVSANAEVPFNEEPALEGSRAYRAPRSQFPAGGTPAAELSPLVRNLSGPVIADSSSQLPESARQLLTELQTREAELRARLEAELQPQRQAVINQLQAMQDQATREARLDDAIAIRAKIRELKCKQPGVIADPGNLYSYRGRHPLTLQIHIIGAIDGPVYGTGTYTDDSDLSTAAVHAGILKVGESDVLEVRILPGQPAYDSSTRNGITSYDYRSWDGSYQFTRARNLPVVAASEQIVDSVSGIGAIGETLKLKVRGVTDGFVWGSEVYTDDSSLGMAAVHAGLLKKDEVGYVTIKLLPGRGDYQTSTQNGITTRSYASWSRSFEFVRTEKPVIEPASTKSIRILPDPGTLMDFRGQIGQSMLFSVTGHAEGFVYGTDIYTDDSTLATAVVHAGIVKPGEKTVVKVTMVDGQNSYTSSSRNGITSRSWNAWSASYRVQNYGYPVKASSELPK